MNELRNGDVVFDEVVCAVRFPTALGPVNQQRGVIPGALDLLR